MTEPALTIVPPHAPNLIQKAARVMAIVEHVPKSGWNDFHRYKYATEADITSAVRAEMAAQGILLIPSVVKSEWASVTTKSGTDRLCTLTVEFTLTDGVEAQRFTVLGEGQDHGDKATYKAMTGALKYALLKLFLIPTGDDPEKDSSPQQAAPAKRAAPPPPKPRPTPEQALAKTPPVQPKPDPIVVREVDPAEEDARLRAAKNITVAAEILQGTIDNKPGAPIHRGLLWKRLTTTRSPKAANEYVATVCGRASAYSDRSEEELRLVVAALDEDGK